MGRRYRKKLSRWSPKGLVLWFLPLPLIPAFLIFLLRGDLARGVATLAALLCFLVAGLWVRKGVRLEQDYSRRTLARAPSLPFKLLGLTAAATGTLISSRYSVGHSLPFAVFMAILTGAGCGLTYGLDPRKDKVGTMTGNFNYTPEEVLEAIQSAETKINGLETSSHQFSNPDLLRRLETIIGLARKIVKSLEDDPRDLRKIRKFITVYLDGAEKVITEYSGTMTRSGDQHLESRFRELLVTIEEVFAQQLQKLRDNEILDLDVKMEVLKKRLQQEGFS